MTDPEHIAPRDHPLCPRPRCPTTTSATWATTAPKPRSTWHSRRAQTQTFTAGDAGSVTIRRDPSTLTVLAADANAGFTSEVEQGTGAEIEVQFGNGAARVDFNAELEDGTVRVRVRVRGVVEDVPVTTMPSTTVRRPRHPTTTAGPVSADDGEDNRGPGDAHDATDDDHSGPGPSGSDDSGSGSSGSDDSGSGHSGSGR